MFFKLSDQRYHELMRKIRELEDDLAQLRTQHERLRGRFYGGQRGDPPPKEPSKADILRAHGFVPGKGFVTDKQAG